MTLLRLLTLVLSLLVPSGLEKTAPTYLTSETAREHLAAATVAGWATNTSSALLLSIAWHESRYQSSARTPESGGRVSCGVMTPEPLAGCSTQDLVDGYVAGGTHLRAWLDATHTTADALTGYAGGYRLLAACHEPDAPRQCGVADVFISRATWITSVLRTR